jgi:hypothetical protein
MSINNNYKFHIFFGDIETFADEDYRVIRPGEEIADEKPASSQRQSGRSQPTKTIEAGEVSAARMDSPKQKASHWRKFLEQLTPRGSVKEPNALGGRIKH